MKNIENLSKSELLSLIHYQLPETHYEDYPIQCTHCGHRPSELLICKDLKPLAYTCDNCYFKMK